MASGMSVLKKYAKTQYGLEDEEQPRSFKDHLKHVYERTGKLLFRVFVSNSSLEPTR